MESRAGIVFLLVIAASLLPAQINYQLTKVGDYLTPRPNGVAGNFNITLATRPAIEANRVVFQDTDFAIWSYNLTTASFVKLVDRNTNVPGGTGVFSSLSPLDGQPLIRNGTVLFLGWDSSGQRYSQGLYSISAAGGPITRVANYLTTNPTGGTFRRFDESGRWGSFAIDNGRVAFFADNPQGATGIYTVGTDGSGLARVIDTTLPPFRPNTAVPDLISQQYSPAISGSTVAFLGTTVFDLSTGYHGIYTTGLSGGGTPVERFNSRMRLPGSTATPYQSRVVTPLQMEGNTIVFSADDSFSNSTFKGLYMLRGSDLITIADHTTALPGLGRLRLQSSFNSFSLNNGRVLFRAEDTSEGGINAAYFLWENGTIRRIIGRGDMIGDERVQTVIDLNPQALSGDRMTFLLDMGFRVVVYVATPATASGAVTVTGLQNSSSYTSNIAAPGSLVTIYGTGLGPSQLAEFTFDPNLRIPNTLAGTRILFGGTPAPLLYVSANQASAIVPYSLEGQTSVPVVAQVQGLSSAPFTVALRPADPGLFAANRAGTGPGAILNQDSSGNTPANPAAPNSIVVLFGSGFGSTNPPSVEGTITPSANPPRLRETVTVTIGGLPADVLYAGPAPGAIAGLYQFNVRIPAGAPSGNLAVRVSLGAVSTQDGLTVSVR